jgi:hypothetical protein
MVKHTLKNNNRGGGKNKTVKIKKIKGGVDTSELLNNTYFITDHDLIKDELLKLNIKQSNKTRENISKSVTSTNCRGNEGLSSMLQRNILIKDNTVIYIHNEEDLLGILCFNILSIDIPEYRSIKLEVICTSKGNNKIGSNLIEILKEFSNNIKAKNIHLDSLNEASNSFYEQHGFKEGNKDSGSYIYKFNKGGKYKKKQTRRKQKN